MISFSHGEGSNWWGAETTSETSQKGSTHSGGGRELVNTDLKLGKKRDLR